MDQVISPTRTSYDRIADAYTQRIAGELAHKPLDRHVLQWFGERVGSGTVCDVGCGPGHVAGYLHAHGVAVTGVDLAPAMVAQARRLQPHIAFMSGDMRALPFADGSLGGIVAFYSLIHIPRDAVVNVLIECKRVLRSNGALLIAFHIGDHVAHFDELWGHAVELDFVFFQPGEMAAYLAAAGFVIEALIEREPYAGVEHPSRRAYIAAGLPR